MDGIGGYQLGTELPNERLMRLINETSIPPKEIYDNMLLLAPNYMIAKVVFLAEVYRQILPVHGVVMEFGTRWGQNLAIMQALRNVLEPFNFSRRLIGFDTWEGFPSVAPQDGTGVKAGDYDSIPGYQAYLQDLLDAKQGLSGLPQQHAQELVGGDVCQTLPWYLEQRPETIVALAYFDLDLYDGTKACLQVLAPRLTKGSILVFDELCHPQFPGETVAVMESLSLNHIRLQRTPYYSWPCYMVVE